MTGDEKAGERVGRGDSSVWEVLWAVQATGPQRAGCTGLHWTETWATRDLGVVSLWEVLEAKSEGTEVEMNNLSVHQELGNWDAFLLVLELNWLPV